MVKMDPPELVPLRTNFRRGHVTNRGVWRIEVNTKLLISDYGLKGSNILDEEGEDDTI